MIDYPNKPLRRQETERVAYTWVAPAGTALATVLQPEFWRHQTAILKVRDTIEIIAEDGSFDVTLRVVDVGRTFVRTRILFGDAEEAPAAPVDDTTLPADERGYKVSFAPKHGWRFASPDGTVIEKDMASKEIAIAARSTYLARMAA